MLEDSVEDLPQDVDQYLRLLQARMKLAQDVTGKKDHKAKLESKAYQDNCKKAEESSLEPGTFVLCLEPEKRLVSSVARPLCGQEDLAWPPTYWAQVTGGLEGDTGMTSRCTCLRR